MGRKTVAELEAENKALKEQVAQGNTEVVSGELVKENTKLKEQLAQVKAHTKESEERLMRELETMGENETLIINGEVQGTGVKVMTPDEYRDYSKAKGTIMGRLPNQKSVCSIEELRALINSDWSPSMVIEKHGMTEGELQQLVWKLSLKELRDRPIKLDIKRDLFGKEG